MKLSSFTQKITVRTVAFLFVAVSVLFIVLGLYKTSDADASAVSGFQAGKIIDDVVFYNPSSMTASEVQSFLNSKVSCDTDGTAPATDWGRPDITHATLASYIRNGTNGYTKNTNFHAPPYTCLKNFKQNTPQVEAASGLCESIPARTNRTAAQIILDVSVACNINPQVLLVLLEKEQSLVTDIWPLNHQYNRATGFACPDNVGGACDPKFNGFYSQVYAAARQFKVYKAYPTSYNYIAGRTNNILWQVVPDGSKEGIFFTNGSPSSRRNGHCGYSQVTIQNQATAALYIYTPYRPNSAALSSYPGTGDACSAYGNRNFYGMFTSWFGSTYAYQVKGSIGQHYEEIDGYKSLGYPLGNEIKLSSGGVYQQFEKGRIYWKSGVGAWATKGSIGSYYYKTLRADLSALGYPTKDEIKLSSGGVYQQFEKGRIYWKSGVGAWAIYGSIGDHYINVNAHSSRLGLPTGAEVKLATGGVYQQFEKGRIYWKSGVGAWDVGGSIGNRYYNELKGTESALGYPIDIERQGVNDSIYQQFEKGRIYWSSIHGTYSIYGEIGKYYENNTSTGLPKSNEVRLATGGVYQQFEKGRIYWKSGVGAWATKGSIGSHYYKVNASNGVLKYPSSDEITARPDTKYQNFEGGRIYWNVSLATKDVRGSIGQYYIKIGAHSSRLGLPTGAEVKLATGGVYQQFEKGRIYWKSGVGAWDVGGSINSLYQKLGADKSKLGYPMGAESGSALTSITQKYQRGTITYKDGKTTYRLN